MAVLLPALALGAAVAWQTVEGQRAAVEGRMRDTSRALAFVLDREFAGVASALDGLATSPAFLPDPSIPDLAALDLQARRLAQRIGAYITVVAQDGRLLLTTALPTLQAPARIRSREVVDRVVATNEAAVGDLMVGTLSGRPVVPVGVPVRRADWGVELVAGASVEASRLRGLLTAQQLPEGVFAAITDARGVIVARSDRQHDAVIGRPLPPENARRLAGRQSGMFHGPALDGVEQIFAFHGVPSAPGWTVFVAAPAAALATAWRAPMLNMAAGGALALLLGGVFALLVARRIVLPVRRLRDHAMAVGAAPALDGASAGELPAASVAEVEQLRQGFATAEAALRQHEVEMAGVLEASGLGVFVIDRDWRITVVGGRAGAWLGEERELRGRVLWDVFPEAVGGPFWEAYRRTMTERVATTVDARCAPTGRLLQAESHPRPDGGIVVLFRDLTEQRAAAARLEESEARFRAMADNIPQLAWMAQQDGWIFWYNKRWYEFTGTTPEEMLGWGWRKTHHPAHVERVVERMQRAFAGGEPWQDTFPMRGADGTFRWFLTRAMPVRDAEGRIAMWFGTNTDVTEERAVQAALRANEVRLRLALEAGRIGTFVWDLCDGTLAWDLRMRALWGMPPDAAPSAVKLREGLHPDDLPRLEQALAAAADPAGNGGFEVECRVIGQSDGVERHIAMHGRVEFAEGRARRMIGTASDVTPLRRAAQVLAREADQLEALAERRGRALAESEARLAAAARMEALGRLAGGIAHDFNNVLQAVQGGIRLAEKRLADDPGGVRRYLGLASDAAVRGAAVTGRLLSFARRGELRAAAIAPVQLLEGLAEMLRATIGPGIALRVEAPPGLPPLWADRSQLEAVLVNLANNARDALEGGGVVTLRAELASAPGEVEPAGQARATGLLLSVLDTGEGMTPEVLSRVTEPFFTTTPKGKATGLGLAMARGFAEQSGGALSIDSAPRRGTTVSIWLPRASEATEAASRSAGLRVTAHPAPSTLLRHATTVLVAEDERDVREILVAELAERGFTVVAAEDAAAALARLDDGLRPDAVVTDLAMPGGMDGLGLLREARKRLPRLPAVLVTGHAGEAVPEMLEAAERGGPFALVRKPAAAEVLADRLGRVLGQGRATVQAAE